MIRRCALIPALAILSSCAAGPSNPTDILPQDASRPAAVPYWSQTITWAAKVTVSCTIESNGLPTGCQVRKIIGNPAFGDSALEYARSLVYEPGYRSGNAKVEPDHLIQIGFQAAGQGLPRDAPAAAAVLPNVEYPPTVKDPAPATVRLSCTIQVDGSTAGCTILQRNGDPALTEAALRYARQAHYAPAWQRGHAVPEPNHIITLIFKPPPEPFVNLPPAPAGVIFGKPVYANRLRYPDGAVGRRAEADVLVLCDLGADGVNRNCTVAGIHGDPIFGPAALAFISGETLHATSAGQPVAVPHRPIVVRFRTRDSTW